MILIIGGAYQGKTDYLKSNFNFCDDDIADGSKCEFQDIFKSACIKNYHILIKRLISENTEPIEFTNKLCKENPQAVIILNEIGYGIIPLEKSERLWRELVGKCGCILAEKSDKVIRIVCGIPNIIKDIEKGESI